MDRILIRDLAARCILGVDDDERRAKQDVVVCLALSTDLRRAGRSDALDDGIDYRALKKRVLAVVEESRFHLLEALAEAVADACLATPGVRAVRVTVDKPGALRFARSVAVEIVRRAPAIARAFIGVGSNIAPEENIPAALRLLSRRVRLVGVSTFYRTPAEERPEQPDYRNGVVAVETDLPPPALRRDVLRAIERRLGRRRSGDRLAARPIDLDLLLYGAAQPPAPDIEARAFVAIPLAEIAPDVVIPGTGARARDVAARFRRPRMARDAGLTREVRRMWRTS